MINKPVHINEIRLGSTRSGILLEYAENVVFFTKDIRTATTQIEILKEFVGKLAYKYHLKSQSIYESD